MKILLLSDSYPPRQAGGAEVVAATSATQLRKEGHEVLVVTTVRDAKDAGIMEYEGVPVCAIATSYPLRYRGWVSLWNPTAIRALRDILADFKPEVVHAHNIHTYFSYAALKAAQRSGAKVVLTAHDAMLVHYGKLDADEQVSVMRQWRTHHWRFNPLRRLAIRYYLRFVDQVVAVSAALKNVLVRNGVRNVEVIHNRIDAAAWDCTAEEVERFKIKHDLLDKKVALFGGRLSPAKGGEQAIRAMEQVCKKIPEAVLLVMGEKNSYAEEMLILAGAQGIDKNIVFTGWLAGEELRAAYHASDVVLVPSVYFDPFPTVNLEAMACGRPVIATCFGGSREAVMDGQTGYIIDPRRPEKIAEKTLELLQNPQQAETMGVAARERIESEFNLKNVAEPYLVWYRKLSKN